MYYLCEKYYKHIIVQCCVTNCVSRVPRLTLLDLQTNCTYEPALEMEPVFMGLTMLFYSLAIYFRLVRLCVGCVYSD